MEQKTVFLSSLLIKTPFFVEKYQMAKCGYTLRTYGTPPIAISLVFYQYSVPNGAIWKIFCKNTPFF